MDASRPSRVASLAGVPPGPRARRSGAAVALVPLESGGRAGTPPGPHQDRVPRRGARTWGARAPALTLQRAHHPKICHYKRLSNKLRELALLGRGPVDE